MFSADREAIDLLAAIICPFNPERIEITTIDSIRGTNH
jgi:hypothetical protein